MKNYELVKEFQKRKLALKNCPFCGGKAQLIENGVQLMRRAWRGYFVRCSVCYCMTGVCYKHKAIERWNKRKGVQVLNALKSCRKPV